MPISPEIFSVAPHPYRNLEPEDAHRFRCLDDIGNCALASGDYAWFDTVYGNLSPEQQRLYGEHGLHILEDVVVEEPPVVPGPLSQSRLDELVELKQRDMAGFWAEAWRPPLRTQDYEKLGAEFDESIPELLSDQAFVQVEAYETLLRWERMARLPAWRRYMDYLEIDRETFDAAVENGLIVIPERTSMRQRAARAIAGLRQHLRQ